MTNGIQFVQGGPIDNKSPPFSEETSLDLVAVPLPHVYLSPRAPGHLYAGINESLHDALNNLKTEKNKKIISKGHAPPTTAILRAAVGKISTDRDGILMWRPTPTEEERNILRTISSISNLSPLQESTWKKMVKMTTKPESILHKALFVLEMIGARTADGYLVRVENRVSAIVDPYDERDDIFFKTFAEFITGLEFTKEVTPAADGQRWHQGLDWSVIAEMANTTVVEY